MTMYSPPDYHLVRSITPAGCGGDFWLEPNGNLLFVVGGIGCGATAVEEYSNSGKLLLTISGFGTTPINVTTDAGGNAYVLGVSEKEISGYCYQSKPRVYVYASGSSEPKYVIDKGLSNRSFVQMTVDSTGYLYVEFEVPNPIKGDSPGWNAIVAYAPSATTPAYTIPVAPLSSDWNSYGQNMETFNGQLYVGGTESRKEGGGVQIDVYQEHSNKKAYVIKGPSIPGAPSALGFDHIGTLYSLEQPYLTLFAPGQNTPEDTITLGPCCGNLFFAVAQ